MGEIKNASFITNSHHVIVVNDTLSSVDLCGIIRGRFCIGFMGIDGVFNKYIAYRMAWLECFFGNIVALFCVIWRGFGLSKMVKSSA